MISGIIWRMLAKENEIDMIQKNFVVAIEGNIGAGKSTLINYLKQFKDVQVHAEPIEKWCRNAYFPFLFENEG